MVSITKIKKAVFPVAGLGTRFLPATKANPKEMLPVVDKPLIQYAVEEAVAAGMTEMIFVTSSAKYAIEDHFDSNFELESKLANEDKQALLSIVRNILPKQVTCSYIRQPDALGLGHAVLCAKPIVGNEPFAVLLADDLIDNCDKPCLRKMVELFEQEQASSILVQELAESDLERYGVVDLAKPLKNHARLQGIVEKPSAEQAPSNYGVIGRYILTSRIFDLLENLPKGSGGEIQLTDGIARLLREEPVYALKLAGKRYDCGSKIGYLEATVQFALKHPELSTDFRKLLRSLSI